MLEVDLSWVGLFPLTSFPWGWKHPFIPYPWLPCLLISMIWQTLPWPEFLLQKCVSGCCSQTEGPRRAALTASCIAEVSDQLWNSQPIQQHPLGQRSACQGSEQVNSAAAQHGLEIQEKDDRSTQRMSNEIRAVKPQKHGHCMKWVATPNPAESDSQ